MTLPTENGHAAPPVESRKSCQSVHSYSKSETGEFSCESNRAASSILQNWDSIDCRRIGHFDPILSALFSLLLSCCLLLFRLLNTTDKSETPEHVRMTHQRERERETRIKKQPRSNNVHAEARTKSLRHAKSTQISSPNKYTEKPRELVFSSLSVSVFFLCLSLSLSLSPCDVVLCCVVLCCVVLCCVVLCCVVFVLCLCCVCVMLCCVVVCVRCAVCGVRCDTLKNPVCPLKTSPCVCSKRLRVYGHHAHMLKHMCAW